MPSPWTPYSRGVGIRCLASQLRGPIPPGLKSADSFTTPSVLLPAASMHTSVASWNAYNAELEVTGVPMDTCQKYKQLDLNVHFIYTCAYIYIYILYVCIYIYTYSIIYIYIYIYIYILHKYNII